MTGDERLSGAERTAWLRSRTDGERRAWLLSTRPTPWLDFPTLLTRARDGDRRARNVALARMVHRADACAKTWARLWGRPDHVDDLRQVALVAFDGAIDRWKGLGPFPTYATRCAEHALTRYLVRERRHLHDPPSDNLLYATGWAPSETEPTLLGAAYDYGTGAPRLLAETPRSDDETEETAAPIGGDELAERRARWFNGLRAEGEADAPDPLEVAELHDERRRRLARALRPLSIRDRKIVRAAIGGEVSTVDLAQRFGITERRVQQIVGAVSDLKPTGTE